METDPLRRRAWVILCEWMIVYWLWIEGLGVAPGDAFDLVWPTDGGGP